MKLVCETDSSFRKIVRRVKLIQGGETCLKESPSTITNFQGGGGGGGKNIFRWGKRRNEVTSCIKLLCVSVASVSELPSSWCTWMEVRRKGSLVPTEWR